MQYASARELFEAAREASKDADRIGRQLRSMEERALSLGGSGFGPRVSTTADPDRMGQRIGALIDMEGRLRQRQEDDYALMDLACAVLYGKDNDAGLRQLTDWRADAIWYHYLDGRTWAETGAILGYSEQYVWQQVQVALDMCDGLGIENVIAGMGSAT